MATRVSRGVAFTRISRFILTCRAPRRWRLHWTDAATNTVIEQGLPERAKRRRHGRRHGAPPAITTDRPGKSRPPPRTVQRLAAAGGAGVEKSDHPRSTHRACRAVGRTVGVGWLRAGAYPPPPQTQTARESHGPPAPEATATGTAGSCQIGLRPKSTRDRRSPAMHRP